MISTSPHPSEHASFRRRPESSPLRAVARKKRLISPLTRLKGWIPASAGMTLLLLLTFLFSPTSATAAATPFAQWHSSQWYRNTSTLDLDFINDRYWLNGTQYSGVANFISGAGATFTRAGTTNVTSTTPPFYLDSNQGQAFVSRASVSNNVTSVFPPFYMGGGQAFVSRASTATYFDSSGVLQTAAINTARTNYTYNGSSWVNSGTLLEPAATNKIRNNTMAGAVASSAVTAQTISSITNSTTTATVTTASPHGLSTSNIVVIAGATPSAYNGTFSISVTSSTTFTYTMASDPGGSASVIGSYIARTRGTLPTNWLAGIGSGLTFTVVGTGTTSGINYIDIRIAGTSTATNTLAVFYFDSGTGIAASNAQTWTETMYLAMTSGSASNIATTTPGWQQFDSTPVPLSSQQGSNWGVPTATLTRYTNTNTTNNANTAYLYPYYFINCNVGDVDITIRIGMPQLEQSSYSTSVIATSSVAVTRSADVYSQQPASYFNSSGTLTFSAADTARTNYTYNGSTWTSAGTLIEPAATNLVTNSTVITASTNTTVTSDTIAAPDGTTTADKLIETTATGTPRHFSGKNVTITAGAPYSYSVFLKAAGRNYAYLWGGKSATPFTRGGLVVNLTDGSFVNADSGTPTSVTNRSVTSVGNGWYRATVTTIIDDTSTDGYLEFGPCTSSTLASCYYNGDGSSGIYAWGQQIESGTSATSYIPTINSSITRTADVYSAPTGGTYFDSSGVLKQATAGSPRIDHSPVSPYSTRGILIEESRINRLPYSTSPSSGTKIISNMTVTDNAATAPDGTTTATSVLETTTNAGHYIEDKNLTIAANQVVTFSFYLKPIGSRTIFPAYLYANTYADEAHVWFNTDTVTVSNGAAGGTGTYSSASITALSNGWYYCTITGQATTSAVTDLWPRIMIINGGTTYAGDTTQGFYVWGRQLETASTPTSYIPTNGSAVTRAADVFTVPTTASGASGAWYTSGAATFAATGTVPYNKASYAPLGALMNSSDIYQAIQIHAGSTLAAMGAQIWKNSGCSWAPGGTTYTYGNLAKIIVASQSLDFSLTANGTSLATTTASTCFPTTLDQLRVGSERTKSVYANGWINRMWYMPTRQPDYSLLDYTR